MLPIKDNVPTERTPLVTLALIAACVALFAYQQTLSGAPGSGGGPSAISARQEFSVSHGAIPDRLLRPYRECGVAAAAGGDAQVFCGEQALIAAGAVDSAPWLIALATSLFLSAGLLQLILNVLALWLLGNTLEDDLGGAGILAVYLLGGIAGLYAQTAIDPGSTLPLAGAAGGAAAVVGGYLMLHPKAKILIFSVVPLLGGFAEVAVLPLAAGWLILQLLPVISELSLTGVADGPARPYLVAIGGLILGLAIIRLLGRTGSGEPAPADGR